MCNASSVGATTVHKQDRVNDLCTRNKASISGVMARSDNANAFFESMCKSVKATNSTTKWTRSSKP
ncbi:MAG: hypothetical protein QXG63_03485 [Nitrososphaerales archaeon]